MKLCDLVWILHINKFIFGGPNMNVRLGGGVILSFMPKQNRLD